MNAFTGSLRAGWSAVLRSKRLLGLVALSTAAIALPAALFVGRVVHAAASRRPDANDLARSLDPDFFAELRQAIPDLDGQITALVVGAFVVYFALRPLVWGGYCGIAATDRKMPFATFVREGGVLYWKFFRLVLIGAAALWLVSLALKPGLRWVEDVAEARPDEISAIRWTKTGHFAALGVLFLVKIVLDHAKVAMRRVRSRGVFRQLASAAVFVARHPFRTIGLFLAARTLELAVTLPFLVLLNVLEGAYLPTNVVIGVLGTLLVALREASALFHVAAAYHLQVVVRAQEGAPPDALPEGEPDLLQGPLPWHES